MASRSYRPPAPFDGAPLSRRLSGAGLALGFNLLLLLVLLGIGAFQPDEPKPPSTALVVDMLPESHSVERKTPPAPAKPQSVRKPPRPLPRITSPIPPIAPAPRTPDFIEMSKEEMAAADIANLPKAGSSAGDSEEVGRGPHGEVLYAAEWVREPTNAELRGYLPRNPRSGVGLVACKTVPGNRVEDCVELGNDPPGTHLASTLRQAAWQFRVKPPRKGGKTLVGAWVRIYLDFTVASD